MKKMKEFERGKLVRIRAYEHARTLGDGVLLVWGDTPSQPPIFTARDAGDIPERILRDRKVYMVTDLNHISGNMLKTLLSPFGAELIVELTGSPTYPVSKGIWRIRKQEGEKIEFAQFSKSTGTTGQPISLSESELTYKEGVFRVESSRVGTELDPVLVGKLQKFRIHPVRYENIVPDFPAGMVVNAKKIVRRWEKAFAKSGFADWENAKISLDGIGISVGKIYGKNDNSAFFDKFTGRLCHVRDRVTLWDASGEKHTDVYKGNTRCKYRASDCRVAYETLEVAEDNGYVSVVGEDSAYVFPEQDTFYSEIVGGRLSGRPNCELDSYHTPSGRINTVSDIQPRPVRDVRFGMEIEKTARPEFAWDSRELRHLRHAITADSSVSRGFELVTARMNLYSTDSDMQLDRIKDFINVSAEDDYDYDPDDDDNEETAGGHIHVSMRGISGGRLLEGISGWIPILYSMYACRRGAYYANFRKYSTLADSGEKYQAIRVFSDRIEIRLFPEVYNIKVAKFRVNLLRAIFNNLDVSFEDLIVKLVDGESDLYKAFHNEYSPYLNRDERYLSMLQRAVRMAARYADNIEGINHYNIEKAVVDTAKKLGISMRHRFDQYSDYVDNSLDTMEAEASDLVG